MKVKVRPAGSMMTVEDALKQTYEIASLDALMVYLNERYEFFEPKPENILQKRWGFDERINWDTYLLTVADKATLFMDGPVQGVPMSTRAGPDGVKPMMCARCTQWMHLIARYPDRREYRCPSGHVTRLEKDGDTGRWPDEMHLDF